MPVWALRYWRHGVAVAALALVAWGCVTAYGWAYGHGYNAANVRAEQVIAEFHAAERNAAERARAAEQAITAAQAEARDEAESRNAQIQSDYERRLAGADAERERLQQHWRACATDRLSAGAAAAGAIAEQDRLRRASAARIVRAVELAQSERDEVIDMCQAVHEASQGLEK